jgi:transposase
MYVDEINKKQGKKIYKTFLIRESYRDKDGNVKHNTVANISKLPLEYIQQIREMLRNKKGDFKLEDLKNGRACEYGASYVFKDLSKQIGLEQAISSRKSQWREDVMAMIIGRILYQGSKLSLVNQYRDTALWELAGHEYGTRPDVEKHCYLPMDELLKRKKRIERKLAKKHLTDGCIILYDITNTWFEGEYENSRKVAFGKGKGGKVGYKQIALGLLTNKEGCPVGVEIFKGNISDQTTVLEQIKKLSDKYGIKHAVFTGDRGMLTAKRVDEISETNFKVITALTHLEMKKLLEKEDIQKDLFDEKNITEVVDSETGTRYALCKNEQEMLKERKTRRAMIEKVKSLLEKKASVTRKRDPMKVAAGIGRIFEKYRIEKFFSWNIDDSGHLSWSLKQDRIDAEEELDGCYVIKTTAGPEVISKEEFVLGYRNLQKVEQGFKNMKTVLLELRPVYHKKDDRIESHIFIVMLAYYLQWHALERLKPLFEADGKGKDRRWTMETVIERLKSIRKVDNLVNGIVVKRNITEPDDEQENILSLLKVKLK